MNWSNQIKSSLGEGARQNKDIKVEIVIIEVMFFREHVKNSEFWDKKLLFFLNFLTCIKFEPDCPEIDNSVKKISGS